MPLSSEHIPLPCSLQDKVLSEFAPADLPSDIVPLSREKLIGFLAKSKDTDASPLATIKRRAAKDNLRPDLRAEDQATLAWVCDAFDEWQERYPLEQPLRDHARRLLPLAIAMALSDDAFYTPGNHPLHGLLDALQNGAVGWQVRLDRAGQMLEQRVQRAVEKSLDWFNNKNLDIAAITQELTAANERDAARAQRMVQRLAETEEARLRTLSARRDAAREINAGLDNHELPAAIGDFLKGPWYDSAQRVLIKHGEQSSEWEQMRRATRHLMESVQSPTDAGAAGRDRQEQMLRRLPGELRRWLLSLEHDSDATDSAMGLVEYAHLRIQHGQQLQLIEISPIPVDEETVDERARNDEQFDTGSWYSFEDEHGELRAQLVLQLENGQHLLFVNFVGLKALDLSRSVFSQRLLDGFSLPLTNRDTFSVSLAAAAGISSDEDLQNLIDPNRAAVDAAPQPAAAPSRDEPSRDEPSSDEFSLEQLEELDDGTSESITLASAEPAIWDDELPNLSDPQQDDPILTPPEGAETELTLEFDETPLEEAAPAMRSPDVSPSYHAPQAPPAPAQPPATPPQQAYTAHSAPPLPTSSPFVRSTPPLAPTTPAPRVVPPPEPPPQLSPEAPAEPTPRAEPIPSFTPAPAPIPEPSPVAASQVEPKPAPPAEPIPAPIPAPPPEPIPATPAESAPAPIPAPPLEAAPAPPTESAPAPPVYSTPAPTPAPPAASTPPAQETPAQPPVPEPTPTPAPSPQPTFAPQAPVPAPPPETPPPAETPRFTPVPSPPDATREVDVPMGAWLGFHDGETPIMAKLAVYDPRRDNYIFVNRKGIAMRELSRAELLILIDQGLVDVLETRSYFRDEVERAREEGQ